MRCRYVCEHASLLIDRACEDATELALHAHVAGCRECARYIAQLRSTVRALGQLRGGPASDLQRAVALQAFVAFGHARAQKVD